MLHGRGRIVFNHSSQNKAYPREGYLNPSVSTLCQIHLLQPFSLSALTLLQSEEAWNTLWWTSQSLVSARFTFHKYRAKNRFGRGKQLETPEDSRKTKFLAMLSWFGSTWPLVKMLMASAYGFLIQARLRLWHKVDNFFIHQTCKQNPMLIISTIT